MFCQMQRASKQSMSTVEERLNDRKYDNLTYEVVKNYWESLGDDAYPEQYSIVLEYLRVKHPQDKEHIKLMGDKVIERLQWYVGDSGVPLNEYLRIDTADLALSAYRYLLERDSGVETEFKRGLRDAITQLFHKVNIEWWKDINSGKSARESNWTAVTNKLRQFANFQFTRLHLKNGLSKEYPDLYDFYAHIGQQTPVGDSNDFYKSQIRDYLLLLNVVPSATDTIAKIDRLKVYTEKEVAKLVPKVTWNVTDARLLVSIWKVAVSEIETGNIITPIMQRLCNELSELIREDPEDPSLQESMKLLADEGFTPNINGPEENETPKSESGDVSDSDDDSVKSGSSGNGGRTGTSTGIGIGTGAAASATGGGGTSTGPGGVGSTVPAATGDSDVFKKLTVQPGLLSVPKFREEIACELGKFVGEQWIAWPHILQLMVDDTVSFLDANRLSESFVKAYDKAAGRK
jgi:hypothetical protein